MYSDSPNRVINMRRFQERVRHYGKYGTDLTDEQTFGRTSDGAYGCDANQAAQDWVDDVINMDVTPLIAKFFTKMINEGLNYVLWEIKC